MLQSLITVSIRTACASDHGQLIPLFSEIDRLHLEGAPWLFQEPARDPRPLEYLETLLADTNTAVLVAEAAVCVGLATIHLRAAPAFPIFIQQKRAVIDDIVVHPDWRRKGIGRRLYESCEDWASERNAAWLEINVYDFNAEARAFYAAVGFEPTMYKMRKPFRKRW